MNGTLTEWLKQVEWILNNIDVGVHLVDRNGTTVFYNRTMADIDGIDQEQALGQNFFHLFPSLTDETSTLHHVLETGEKVVEKIQTYVNLTGKHITTINSTYPLYDDCNRIIGAVEIARDITRIVELNDQILDLRKQLSERNKNRKSEGTAQYHFSDLIGESPAFQQAVAIAKRASRSQSPVMIYGETGTGKDLVAQSIHNASIRRDQPFVAQNCAAVPRDLMESILFGTTRGAFTGAVDRPGLFEQAHEGTLFLDELNSLDKDLQSKLLRVLQDGRIRRIGGTREKDVDVRIIAAMNVPPHEALEKGLIRSDLYYRLNVVTIHMPPLSRRTEDIPLLIDHFVDKFNGMFGTRVKGVETEALQLLMQYAWPGNIRELSHAIESAFNMIDTGCQWISREHLPPNLVSTGRGVGLANTPDPQHHSSKINLPNMLDQIERDAILNALRENDWNITHTAEALGLKRQSLQYKIEKYKLDRYH